MTELEVEIAPTEGGKLADLRAAPELMSEELIEQMLGHYFDTECGPGHWTQFWDQWIDIPDMRPHVQARSLGGHNESSIEFVSFETGEPVVGKSFYVRNGVTGAGESFRQIVAQLERLASEGRGVRILHAGVDGAPDQFSAVLVFEHFGHPDYGKAVLLGDGEKFDKLRYINHPKLSEPFSVSVEARQWTRDKLLEVLDTHSDGHLENAMYRVVIPRPNAVIPENEFTKKFEYQSGGRVYPYVIQVIAIDPGSYATAEDLKLRQATDLATVGDQYQHFTRVFQKGRLDAAGELRIQVGDRLVEKHELAQANPLPIVDLPSQLQLLDVSKIHRADGSLLELVSEFEAVVDSDWNTLFDLSSVHIGTDPMIAVLKASLYTSLGDLSQQYNRWHLELEFEPGGSFVLLRPSMAAGPFRLNELEFMPKQQFEILARQAAKGQIPQFELARIQRASLRPTNLVERVVNVA